MRLTAAGVTWTVDDREIVSGADIEVGTGELVGLVGPNGSGKSTLLRCVYRALRPDAGTVLADGRDLWRMRSRAAARQLAVVVQEPASDFDLTAYEVVLMGRMPHLGTLDRETAADHDLVREALGAVDAGHLAGRSFPTLSGGEKQRVLLARALAQQAPVLILDEPTNHLDIRHQLDLLGLVRRLGLATIAALHDLNLACEYCDRLYVLQSGRVVASGAPGDVMTPKLIEAVFQVGATTAIHPVTGRTHLSFHPLPGNSPGTNDRVAPTSLRAGLPVRPVAHPPGSEAS